MSLNCTWPTSLLDDRETINRYGFEVAVLMMATGMSSITENNFDELLFRVRVYDAIYGGETTIDLRKWVGMHTNVSQEARRTWVSRVKKGRRFEAERLAKLAGRDLKEAIADFNTKFNQVLEDAANDSGRTA